jgi:O-antigen/teichoic acid export membrane protein
MIVILAGSAVMRLFGAGFVAGTDVLVILTLAMAINGILGVSELITLIDKPWINLVNAAWSVLVSAGLNILLIPLYGIMGAAWAVLILNTTLNAARVLQVLFLYKLQPFTRFHAKVVAAAILSIGAIWGARQMLGVSGDAVDLGGLLVCWVLYFALLFVFGPAPEEKALVDRWRNRAGFSHERAS